MRTPCAPTHTCSTATYTCTTSFSAHTHLHSSLVQIHPPHDIPHPTPPALAPGTGPPSTWKIADASSTGHPPRPIHPLPFPTHPSKPHTPGTGRPSTWTTAGASSHGMHMISTTTPASQRGGPRTVMMPRPCPTSPPRLHWQLPPPGTDTEAAGRLPRRCHAAATHPPGSCHTATKQLTHSCNAVARHLPYSCKAAAAQLHHRSTGTSLAGLQNGHSTWMPYTRARYMLWYHISQGWPPHRVPQGFA